MDIDKQGDGAQLGPQFGDGSHVAAGNQHRIRPLVGMRFHGGVIARSLQAGSQACGIGAHQQHHGFGHHDGFATWGRPQPNLLRNTWKNSWSTSRTKRTGLSLRRINIRSSGQM